MKRTLVYLLPLTMLWMASCSKKTPVVNYQAPDFTGVYTTKLSRLHENLTTGKLDTAYANLILTLNSSGTFSVAGDTATVQAGSHGSYALGYQTNLTFVDSTLPKTGTPAKTHLDGSYIYQYTSGLLILVKTIGDSVRYEYDCTKNE